MCSLCSGLFLEIKKESKKIQASQVNTYPSFESLKCNIVIFEHVLNVNVLLKTFFEIISIYLKVNTEFINSSCNQQKIHRTV